MNINRLTFTPMNYPIDTLLDGILTKAIKSGIKTINTTDSYSLKLIFNDGSEFSAWNVNKYYAWLKKGLFESIDGTKYAWEGARPKRKTMCDLLDALSKFEY
jgi:hypothetical protein